MNQVLTDCQVWNKGLEIPYFEISEEKKAGVWEYDLQSGRLHWSPEQYRLYGYEPQEVCLDNDFFLLKTTHASDVKRISKIIENALSWEEKYTFRRRIIRKNDTVGFVETEAILIRSLKGVVKKILGTTVDLQQNDKAETLDNSDPRFFNKLFQDYHRTINRQIFMQVQDEDIAKDLCQEVFLKAWHSMSQYNNERGELYTWLLNIARNHCIDYFRSRQYKVHAVSSTLKENLHDQEDELFDGSDNVYVRELLFKLPLCQRELMELLFMQGYSQSEIAALKNVPLGTIKSRSRAALKTLRKLALNNKLSGAANAKIA